MSGIAGERPRFIKTYRYLRVAMIGVVIVLAAALARQLWADSWDLHPSISAYYYTPVQAVFVSALVVIGVCMVVLKGNTPWEDTFLNLAGMLAPIVAFVPTPAVNACTASAGVPAGTAANITNNMFALLVGGLAGLVATYLIARAEHDSLAARRPVGAGLLIAAAFWAAATAWFVWGRESFDCGAHYTAAITMFVFIITVVAWNAWGAAGENLAGAARTSYGMLAPLMILSAVVLGFLTWRELISNGVFWIEAALITEFAIFWIIQSRELWVDGLRTAPAGAPTADQTQA
jgi:hypothetical protein